MSQKLNTDITPWNPIDIDKKIWSVGGLAVGGYWIYNFVGINDKVDTVDSQTPRTSVHLYQDTRLDKMSVTAGEHSVSKGAYVAFLNAEGEAVVYVQGHVNSLHISGNAQVFLYDGAYVDFLNCGDGGFVRVDKGASVHGLVIMKDGKAVISTMADIYDKIIKEGAIVSHVPDPADHCLRLRLFFSDIEKRDNFCKRVTEEYRSTGHIILGNLDLYKVCNCFVKPDGVDWNGWSVHLSADKYTRLDGDALGAGIEKVSGAQDVVVYVADDEESDVNFICRN